MKTLILCIVLTVLGSNFTFGQLIKPGDRPDTLVTDSGTFRALIRGKVTQGTYAMGEVMEHMNYMTSLHRHNTFDESIYVLSGYMTVHIQGKTHRLGAGSSIFIPKGTPHAQGNLDPEPVRFLFTMAPSAGFEGFMEGRAEVLKTTKPGTTEFMKKVMVLVPNLDLEVLGPSPVKR
ncbi:cupin domain-containing protein [Spirosoma utsteinense]|uniref:Quercetin dioxygenase-like cupin family protein n=1 Tax=Spirosoma utsteinense TaxID=2585773 RepID=A0ABR6W7M8_9BACT|nr:cupin domain-containing protein [Spirosoma utsteinense]MBC3785649.1 quercetin dioxygenase-like cupin family protein [Spirosoma utsteinense]MBC3791800.1 quercetin dioxygenase-like cupin family protein [Spirosoma utsteinense]